MKLFISLMASFTLFATPAQIIIIRHGEKPPSNVGLSAIGQERSGALAFFFQVNPFVLDFGLPEAIYGFRSKGNRGMETLTPLSEAIHIPIRNLYVSEDTTSLVKDVLSDANHEGKMVLICWEHQNMKELVKKLGGPDIPPYPGSRFDLIYKLTYSKEGPPTFCVGLQNLMQVDLKTYPSDFESYACK